MKKILPGCIIAVALLMGAVYFFIPNKLVISESIQPNCSAGCVQRMVGSALYRQKWWPKEGKQLSPANYLLDGCNFSFPSDMFYNNNIKIGYKDIHPNSTLITEIKGDVSLISWVVEIKSSSNPFTRVSVYFKARHIKKSLQKIMKSFSSFLNSNKNVYGVDMNITTLTDSTLIAIRDTSANYPTVAAIYTNIEKLRSYAAENNAIATNDPMLNIKKAGVTGYDFMVAIPVNKNLLPSGKIITKRMLPGGNFIQTGQIKGGFTVVDSFIKEIENYKADNNDISPAIPFQSLKTDRSKEADSSRWVTKLYYPVF